LGRPGRQVAEHQRVSGDRFFRLELAEQLAVQAADPGLIQRARVMRDQPGQAIPGPDLAQEPGAI
jgi:hypothetical protein